MSFWLLLVLCLRELYVSLWFVRLSVVSLSFYSAATCFFPIFSVMVSQHTGLWFSLWCLFLGFVEFLQAVTSRDLGAWWKFNSYILKLVSCRQILSITLAAGVLRLSLVPGVTKKLFSFPNSSPILSVPVWIFFRLFSLQIYWTLILWLTNGR